MSERAADDGPALAGRSHGKGDGEVTLGDSTVTPIEGVRQEADQRSKRPYQRRGKHPDDGQHDADAEVLEPVFHNLSISQERNPAAGSTVAMSGTATIGTRWPLETSRRTASFSVVMTALAPAATAPASMRATSARLK